MIGATRIALFDAKPNRDQPFRQPFEQVSNLAIVGEISQAEELLEWVRQEAIDLVAVQLDHDSAQALRVIEQINRINPRCGILGVSKSTDPYAIITAMRAGCGQFVCEPIDPEDLKGAVDRLRMTRFTHGGPSKRICVVGSAGGAGATTLACNLALEFAHLSQKTCALVDLNIEFGDVACNFDSTPKFTLADVCRDGTDIDQSMVRSALFELPCRVALLARPEKLEDARQVSPENVEKAFRILAAMYPYVLADLPRSFNFFNASVVAQANRVLIVTQLGVPFIRNAMRLLHCMIDMGADGDCIELIVNRTSGQFERITLKDVEASFGKPIFGVVPNDSKCVMAARDLGHPLSADAPSSPARLAIHEIAKKIAGLENPEGSSPQAKGLLNRFLGRRAKTGA